ncbi:MAG: rhodanese-like domain-containing protein [Armatimonadota bacterium]
MTRRYLLFALIAVVMVGVAGCSSSDSPCCPDCNTDADVQNITAAQLQEMMNDGQPLVLADVRTQEEYDAGHIPGSLHLPLDEIAQWSQTLDPDTRICCICAIGGRSAEAAETLVKAGFSDVYNLTGGMNGWTGEVDTTPEE